MRSIQLAGAFAALCVAFAASAAAADVVIFSSSSLQARARGAAGDVTKIEQVTAVPYSETLTAAAGGESTTSYFQGGQSGFDTQTSQTLSSGNAETQQIIWFSVSTPTYYTASGTFSSAGATGSSDMSVSLFHADSGTPIFNNSQQSQGTLLATSQSFVVGGQAGYLNSLFGSPVGVLAPGKYSWQTRLGSAGNDRVASGNLSLTLSTSPPAVPLPAAVWGGLALFGGLGLKQYRLGLQRYRRSPSAV